MFAWLFSHFIWVLCRLEWITWRLELFLARIHSESVFMANPLWRQLRIAEPHVFLLDIPKC
jgi:hypothetical protein